MESINIYNNLPLELWTHHILPTLPVKTLLQFRSVCKVWRDTIDDLRFVSKHMTLSTNNVEKNQVIALGRGEKLRYRLTVVNKNTLRKQADLFEQSGDYVFHASCNGLFLAQPRFITYDGNWRLLGSPTVNLWNPSIRKSLNIPPCPLLDNFHFYSDVKYIFGFRPSRNDYVVFAFLDDENRPMSFVQANLIMPVSFSVAVYTLSDNLWNIRDYKLILSLDNLLMLSDCVDQIVYRDGVLHWLGKDPHPKSDQGDPSFRTHLVSFDFELENFSYLQLPDVSQASKTETFRYLFVLGESLAIFSISSEWSSIWVLKNKLWNLWFSGTKCFAGFNYIRKNPSVATRVFVEHGGDITLVYGKAIYKIMSDEIQELNESLNLQNLILDNYMESLVLHKGCQGQVINSL
ncbi:F-box/kelch-repeat protein At3g23880-like [Silene latifolia]|uniref:F-box/kelch-repeat protein At3g23880-like n=1 Tax=Silene latifolia TaxID=37657 RepID=UPI003D78561B